MPLKDYLFPEKDQFEVVCKDETQASAEISKGVVYKVIGAIQGLFLMKNNKGEVGKYHRDRFILKDEDD